jgi:hypothetical protein
MHPVRDAILQTLGGAAARLDSSLQAHDSMRYQVARNQAIYSALPTPELKAAFAMDPQGFTTQFMQNYGPQKAAGGETVFYGGPGGPQATAPLLTSQNNRFVTQTPGSTVQTGSAGPTLAASDGVILDKSGQLGQGGVVGTYGAPQKFGPGEYGKSYTPPVTVAGVQGAPGGSGPPPMPAPAPAAPQPPSAPPALNLMTAPNVLSGALGVPVQITSGLRTAAHNAAVGGVPNSAHLTGNAVDFVPQGMSSTDAVTRLAQAGIPFDQLIDEGSNVHIAWGGQQRGQVLRRTPSGGYVNVSAPTPATRPTQTPASMSPGPGGPAPTIPGGFSGGPPPAPLWGPPHKVPGVEGLFQTNSATGEVKKAADQPFGAANINPLYDRVTGDEAYKQGEAASSAYNAMKANAGKMTAPAAFAMLDTMARIANPPGMARPATIKLFEDQFGLSTRAAGALQGSFGQGKLPADVRQQILDSALSFAQSHWDQANSLVQGNVAFAQRHPEINAADIVPPLGDRPQRYMIQEQPGGSAAAPARPRTGADYSALPGGSYYLDPGDNRVHIKPNGR